MARKTTTYGQKGGEGPTRGRKARHLQVGHGGEVYRRRTYLEGRVYWLLSEQCFDGKRFVDLLCFASRQKRNAVERMRNATGECKTLDKGMMSETANMHYKSRVTLWQDDTRLCRAMWSMGGSTSWTWR